MTLNWTMANSSCQAKSAGLSAMPDSTNAAEYDRCHGCDHQVGQRTGGRDVGHAEAAGAQRVGIDLDRLAPAEAGDQEEDGAHRVDVSGRVQADPTHGAGPMVAQLVGHVGVHELVEGDADHQRHQQPDQLRRDPARANSI